MGATVNLYCATTSVIVFTGVLTSRRPHHDVASVLHLQAEYIPTTGLMVKAIHAAGAPSQGVSAKL